MGEAKTDHQWSFPVQEPFDGAKIAILRRNDVLVIRRDNKPNIPWPDCLDFPGGGREGSETPFETVAREAMEEVGLTLPEERVVFHCQMIGPHDLPVHFFALLWDGLTDDMIRFGDEGQSWAFMPIEAFLQADDAIPSLQQRLRLALAALE